MTVENFFKEISQTKSSNLGSNSVTPVIDNMLLKLDSISLNRAVMTLAGSLELQVLNNEYHLISPLNTFYSILRSLY